MRDPKFPDEEEVEPIVEGPALAARTRAMNPSSHDVVLQSRIWAQIRATRELDSSDLSVVVRNRSATLFGTVPDDGQRSQMERVAIGISGVLEVINRLKVVPRSH